MSYSEDLKIFVATIFGEAGNSSEISWKVIAHSIKNRIGFYIWTKQWHSTTTGIIANSGYDAYSHKTPQYKLAKSELDSGNIKNSILKKMITIVEPIFYDLEKDFTDGVVSYFSPNAQKSLHKKNPMMYTSEIPSWAAPPLYRVYIKGTENDDFAWYKIHRTKLYLTFINEVAEPLLTSKVDVVFADKKNVALLSNIIIDKNGSIPEFNIAETMGARFKVNGVLVKDKNNKEVKIVGGNQHKSVKAVIVVDSKKGGIKSKAEIHNQTPSATKPDSSQKSEVAEQKKSNGNDNDSKSTCTFNIKIIDSDGRPIPNISYFLEYKQNKKKHSTGSDGLEKNVTAIEGEKISIFVSGRDSKQKISEFFVNKNLKEQVVKFNLYTFEILFRYENTLKPITNLNLLQTYRGKDYSKQTNHEGKILVKAMPGFDLQYKLRNGKYIITIKVDKNKNLRVIDVNSKVIEQAANDLKSNSESKVADLSTTSDANKSQKPVESKDTTSKRDQKGSTSSEGHPKTKVIDNSEVIFIVETYDKKTNKLFSGGNYSIEYAGKKRNHVSGTHGVGKKSHKGKANEDIKITITNAGKESVIFTGKISKDMKPIELKIEKPSLELSGAHWYSRFMSSKDLADLDEPFGVNIRKFINCLRASGITVVINTTHRPDARGYLMYYSTMIKRGIVDPDNVPPWEGVDIDWSHGGDKNKARKAASEMHAKYGIGNNKIAKPGRSNHNPKKALAVDMSITNFTNKVVNYNGKSKKITSFSDLSAVGKEFNVYWFGSSDKPHWSHNGR